MGGKPRIGSLVAGYRLTSLLGVGATGAVYLAERDGDQVALKLVDPELARDERFRRRVLRESQIAAELDHPNVVPIADFGESKSQLYLAMRYVEGSDLRELLAAEGPLDPARALDLLEEVAGALDAAHERGLVHRDVKPANILVDAHGHAYLSDFGLAKHASSVSSLTADSAFVGTIAYVSPEQIRGDQLDGRADVYSLGCVLYECLTGSPPFDRESELAIVYAHLNERAPRASEARPELPEGFDDVIRKATAKDPNERFRTCAELVAAGRRALAGERIRNRRIGLAMALFVAVAGAVAAVLALVAGGGGGSKPVGPRTAAGVQGVSLLNPQTQRVAGMVKLAERPSAIAFAGRSAWAVLPRNQQLAQIDIASRRQVGAVKLPVAPGGVAPDGDSVFVTEQGGPGLVRVDAATRKVTGKWTVDTRGVQVSDPTGIAAGAGSVWLARGPEVVRVDARTGRVQHRFALPVTATLVTFANGQVWAASSQNGLVEEIDPSLNRISAHVTLHGWISALTVAAGSVWVAVTPDDVIYRLNVDDASVGQIVPAGAGPESLSPARGAVWAAASRGRSLIRIDTRSGDRSAIALTGEPSLALYHRGLLWTVADPAPPALGAVKGPVVRVSSHDELELDPAVGPFPTASQLLYSTCLKLMNYPDARGPAGGVVTPEGATGPPSVSRDRRTYSFTIRPGLRFSRPSNAPVNAETFRHTIERTLSAKANPDPTGLHLAGDIVGARAYSAGRAQHVSGIRAQGNHLTITLVRPSGDLLSRLAMPIFCAVPSTTPNPGSVQGPIPSAGPYYVRSQTASETVLDRNPSYHGSRPRRAARIIYLTGVQTARAVALAGAGQVDLVTWDDDTQGPLAPGGALDRRFGHDPAAARRDGSPRYRQADAPGVDMVAFNTRRPLFRDARLRRAVSYALDRRRLAAIYDERPTDRYVPPAVPGAGGAPVYPLTGPDLAAALRLMPPGGGPRRASIYSCGEPVNLRIAQEIRSNLKPLGIELSIVQSLGCLRGPDPKAGRSDMMLITRATADLDPQPFLESTIGRTFPFGALLGPVTYRDPNVTARLDAIRRLPGSARLAAYHRLEDDLLRGPAPYAAFGAFTGAEYMSNRVGCRLVQGAYHVIDLGALCLRRS
jgi:ABC-type oligopeptide transport system substrate-binding subunit/predicted Ser/Thr protein kinase